MRGAHALVVTTISSPNKALAALAVGSQRAGWDFIAVGDIKSPPDFALPGCRYFSLEAQRVSGIGLATRCPTGHYARKNVGYLLAMRDGAEYIVETDDDNLPRAEFFATRAIERDVAISKRAGWVNAYRWFGTETIWPRGFPLDLVHALPPAPHELPREFRRVPIQQGLADENPDVDAIYRLTFPLPRIFARNVEAALGDGSWCPFNSQNTTWHHDAFALLYLPAHCSFRSTDIWRSFVAQRIATANGWAVLFHGPTVWQERNDHVLMRDFAQEIPGYLHNATIVEALAALTIRPGKALVAENMRVCYEKLVAMSLVADAELALLDQWLAEVDTYATAADE